MRTEWTIEIMNDRLIPFASFPDGSIIGGGSRENLNGQHVVTSNDNWLTTTTKFVMPTGAGLISCMHVVSSTVVLIGTSVGKIYRTVSPFTSVTEVLQMAGTSAWPRSWSFTSKGNLVFVGEYGSKSIGATQNGRRVYKSSDGGATWTQNFISPHTNGQHLHKLLIDPYTDDLFVCHGDGSPYTGITKLSPPNYDVGTVIVNDIQPTGGLVFQDFMLWVQDSGVGGIYKHFKGDNSKILVLDLRSFPQYDDTGFNGLIYDAANQTAYYGTHPSVTASKDVSLFKSVFPFDSWEFIGKIDGIREISKGLEHFAKVQNDLLIGCLNLPSPSMSRAVRITPTINKLRS